MNNSTVFIDLDVHKGSITAACVDAHQDAPVIDLRCWGPQPDGAQQVWVRQ